MSTTGSTVKEDTATTQTSQQQQQLLANGHNVHSNHNHGSTGSTDCNNHHHDHGHSHNHDLTSSSTATTTKTTASSEFQKIIQPEQTSTLRNSSNNNNINSYLDHRHDDTPEMIQQQSIIRKLYISLWIISFFLIVELIGGYLAQSLAIWSDAAHLVSDMAAMIVALLAAHLGTFPVSSQHTFGLKRIESLAALFSTMSLLCISIGLAYEAIRRIYTTMAAVSNDENSADTDDQQQQVNGRLMSIIAFIGVLVNLMLAYVLGEHHVHLPSDDGCGHGHDHTHEHHGHSHHQPDHPTPHTDVTAHDDHLPTKSSTTANSHHAGCSGHSHSHDHHSDGVKDDHNHDHNHAGSYGIDPVTSKAQQPNSESTPLLLPPATTRSNHGQHYDGSNGSDTAPKFEQPSQKQEPPSSKWKIPFSPQNINLQAAYLHVLGDLAQSATVLMAGCIIWIVPSWTIIDPICTLLFCLLVFYSAYHVCKTSIAVLLQQVPSHLNYFDIRDKIASVQYVQDVHDLHIWSISHRVPALTVHVSIAYPPVPDDKVLTSSKPIHDEVLENIYSVVRREFDIIHATIQVQSANGDCVTCVDRLCRPCLLEENENGRYHDVREEGSYYDDADRDANIDIGNTIV